MDGIDAVLASFDEGSLALLGTHSHEYPESLREALRDALLHPEAVGLDRLGTLDREVGECFRDAALTLIEKSGANTRDIAAIGSHGQTLRHRPDGKHPFSLQIGDAATIANGTGIRTVADFRRADIAAGGQGAPLVPPFHDWLFRDRSEQTCVLNIGGIANITSLPVDDSPITGFDTGPGNTLLDAWIRNQRGLPLDEDGEWAASGTTLAPLLAKLLSDDYFEQPPPKSTGFEHFNLAWLGQFDPEQYRPEDIQATLSETDRAQHCGGNRPVHNDARIRCTSVAGARTTGTCFDA